MITNCHSSDSQQLMGTENTKTKQNFNPGSPVALKDISGTAPWCFSLITHRKRKIIVLLLKENIVHCTESCKLSILEKSGLFVKRKLPHGKVKLPSYSITAEFDQKRGRRLCLKPNKSFFQIKKNFSFVCTLSNLHQI